MSLTLPNEADYERRESVLAAFREEFRPFYEIFGDNDSEILSFVYYEGVQDYQVNGLISAAEPFIVGDVLVKVFGCQWCVVEFGDTRCFALQHNSLDSPFKLEPFRWSYAKKELPKRWFVRLNKVIRPKASGP